MSHSQFHSIDLFILRHAWLNLWDKRMLLAESTRLLSQAFVPSLETAGRQNQFTEERAGKVLHGEKTYWWQVFIISHAQVHRMYFERMHFFNFKCKATKKLENILTKLRCLRSCYGEWYYLILFALWEFWCLIQTYIMLTPLLSTFSRPKSWVHVIFSFHFQWLKRDLLVSYS